MSLSISADMPRTVGSSNKLRRESSTPKASRILAMSCAPMSECPPSAKKLSAVPTSATRRRPDNKTDKCSSIGDLGASRESSRRMFSAVGWGRAARSNFPRADTVGGKGSGIRENVGYPIVNLDGAAIRWRDRLPVEKSQAVLIGIRSLLERLVENAVTAAQHGFIVDAVSEADARAECFLVDILRARLSVPTGPTSIIGVSSENAAGARIRKGGVNHGKAILCFGSRQVDVIAHAVIQR